MKNLLELMERAFNMLKAKGLFQGYKNYESWVKEKYPDYKGRNNNKKEQKELKI